MRNRLVVCLLLFFLLVSLSACRGEQPASERVLEIRGLFQSGTQHFSAEITAHYTDHVYHFTLRWNSAASTIEVLAPEIIAGVVVAVSESGTVLHWDGAELNTGPLTEDGLSPLAALPTIVFQWKDGHITNAHYEPFAGVNTVVMTTAISDQVQHMTWFDRDTGLPVKSEILQDGRLVLTAIFEGSPLFGSLGR